MIAYEEMALQIQCDAHDMGDDYGDDSATVMTLARMYDVSPTTVLDILAPEVLYSV